MMSSAAVERRREAPPVPSFSGRAMPRGQSSQNTPTFAVDEREQERVQLFGEFLDSQQCATDALEYKEKVRMMVRRAETRLIVNINDVRLFNEGLSRGLLMTPLEYLPSFETALRRMVDNLLVVEPFGGSDGEKDATVKLSFRIGLDGAFGDFQTNPRELSASTLSQMVSVDGIVTSCFLVRPKLVRSIHYVEERRTFISREYRDALMGSGPPVTSSYPQQDAEGNRLSTEFGLCTYRDQQRIVLQEMPERAPPGQLPRAVEIILGEDLVDKAKPGDRVRIVGIYKGLATSAAGSAPAFFRGILVANAVRQLGREANMPVLTDLDIQQIKAVSQRPDLFTLLARSLAPSIWGHAAIKKAILLMLLGGVEKIVDQTHIRGDINLLMVGDPSTAKSQLLRFVLAIAPLAVATTGRGSTGVGLTAAVAVDRETGERRLEAGAMVLADCGVVCIDEFDKMSEGDRVAIHEVMEQQTVTIAKAGIHLSLNARCSVIAAANPIFSQYREHASPRENIRLPDSLLSRFDLLFIVLDRMNEKTDRMLAEHVLAMHSRVDTTNSEDAAGNSVDDAVFATHRYAATSYDHDVANADMDTGNDDAAASGDSDLLTLSFIRKYIHYAKVRMRPVLSSGAMEAIKAMYLAFRAKSEQSGRDQARTMPVTPRTLETLIRLSTAHAKARLSSIVEEVDTLVAEELVRFSLYKEVIPKCARRPKKTKPISQAGPEDEDQEAQGESNHSHTDNNSEIKQHSDGDDGDTFGFTEEPPSSVAMSLAQASEDGPSTNIQPTDAQILTIKSALLRVRAQNDSFVMLDALIEELHSDGVELPPGTVSVVLQQMETANQLMFRDGIIFFI